MMGQQPILIDGRLGGLAAEDFVQLASIQSHRLGRRGKGFDLVQVLLVYKRRSYMLCSFSAIQILIRDCLGPPNRLAS